MAIKITLDSFLAVIKRSNLLSEEQLNSALEKFRASTEANTDAKTFAEYLVRQKILTVWQAEKVLQGKHKGFFLGRYRLLSLLGKGGMSSVFLAEHTVMKRFCALKVLPAKRVHDASYLGRFHREAQAVAALDHPNIVRAYDVDMAADAGVDIHFLAMEFVKGKSLLELVQEKGPVPIADAAEYVRQSAHGLDHAHQAGLVHRDVKPGNLLVTPTGVIKVLDLGLARFFDDGDHSLTVQHDEKVLGTADYISPEQAIDSHKVDCRTDIYSLGCTLYYLLSGHPPFNSGSLAQRLMAHQTKPAPSISNERPDMPAGLQAIMEKMMAKKADDRYQTAQDVADAIANWQKPPATQAAPVAAVTPVKAVPAAVAAKPAAASPAAAAAKPVAAVAKAPAAKSKPTASPSVSGSRGPAKVAPAPKKSTGSGVAGVGKAAPAPRTAALDISGGGDADLLGDFLAGMSSGVNLPSPAEVSPPVEFSGLDDFSSPVEIPSPVDAAGPLDFDFSALDTPTANDSQTSRSSSKKLAQAAVETADFSDSPTGEVVSAPPPDEEVALDFGLMDQLDQAFDPSLLDVGGLETPETDASAASDDLGSFDVLSDIHSSAPQPKPSSGISKPKSSPSKSAKPKFAIPDLSKIKPQWWAVGGGGVLVLVLGLCWFMFRGGDSGSTAVVPPVVPAKPLPAADLEVIEVGPTGHFATIQEALAFLRKSFRPLSTFEHRTIQVAGGATYAETISIVSNKQSQFPRYVTLRSNGSSPAIIQGNGTQPVFNIQDVESLTIEGFVIDAHDAEAAVRVNGFSPSVQLKSLRVQNFKKTGVLLEDVSAPMGEDFQIEGLRIQAQAQEAVGIRCRAGTGQNTAHIQLKHLRIVGPLKSGIEISGSFTKSQLTESVIAGCSVGLRFEGGTFDEVSLINNTLAKNGRGIVFSKLPTPESRNLKVLHTLFSGNTQSDAVLENGDVAGLAEKLLAPQDGRHHNRTDRKDPDVKGVDLFTGDGQRGATTNFVSNAADAPNYMKPILEVKVGNPTGGAKGYVGAVAP